MSDTPCHGTLQAIARDLDTCDLTQAIGTLAAKRKARRHRQACFAEIRRLNREQGLDAITDEELLNGLTEVPSVLSPPHR